LKSPSTRVTKSRATEIKVQEFDHVMVRGAREHNLKNIDIDIPKKKLVVITGVSGSGKSSLAFDTIFAEGQRRYVESLSSYARQFLGQSEKPAFDTIRGLSPTISIEQKSASKNPRSTVGTITEVYDYLRVMYARAGTQYCHKCGEAVGRGDAASMVEQIIAMSEETKILLLAPIIENRKGEHKDLLLELRGEGYSRIRIDGVVHEIADVQGLAKNKKHSIEVVVDRLVIKHRSDFRKRLTDSVENCLIRGNGHLIVHVIGKKDLPMSEARSCCGHAFPELDPPIFSFNSPLGMCPECNGLGTVLAMDEERIIPDASLTIRGGAILPWKNYFSDEHNEKKAKNKEEDRESWGLARLRAMQKQWQVDIDVPWKKLPKKKRDLILHGSKGEELTVAWKGGKSSSSYTFAYEGLLKSLMRRYLQTQSDGMKTWYGKFMSSSVCHQCEGTRLKPEVVAVRIADKSIVDICQMSIADLHNFFLNLKLTGNQKVIAGELLKEIVSRIGFLINVGLDYLSLDRKGPTLSGGEAQRIRLASQIGSELTGVLYILDEPSIGLHQRDNRKLLNTLCHLRDIGNSLLVVEHDQETMESADWIIDIGPGAGHLGGEVVAQGTPTQIKKNRASTTGAYLAGRLQIEAPKTRRQPSDHGDRWIVISDADENNLKNVTASIPLGLFTCISGVSGAGKSTLINHILYPALARRLHQAALPTGSYGNISGLEFIDKVINIDQRPIGRTPRSNPATYTKVFDLIRDFFALLPEAKVRGYSKGRFSFNVKGGRCENCQGDGHIKVEMHFLADVYVPCEVCKGKRFNDATLEVKYRSYSIADVLNLSVAEARDLFINHRKIITILDSLMEVGLTYVKLGQPATTLSGGEAQRIKLARELAKTATGRTLYILDEPTTGLHFTDIQKLVEVLQKLVTAGNSIVVIEHNLDVIKSADWLIDMGPEGGDRGGYIIAEGPPEKVCMSKKSYTADYLRPLLASAGNRRLRRTNLAAE
jgi:excinuclease ABC subunit A